MFTWLVETSRGRELGSSNEEEPGRQWSNIGAGGKEHLYYRSRLQEAEDPQVSRSYLWLSRSVYFFFTESDYIYKNPIKKKNFFFPSYLHVAGTFSSSQRRFFWEKPSKRSGTRKTDSDPPSLLQSWCRWTASSLSVCTPSCTNPNTLLCTPAPRPSAEPAFPHRRWVQNSLVTSRSSYKTSSPLWQCRKRL